MTQQETETPRADLVIRTASVGELDALADTLGRAFDDDPVMNHIVPQDAKRSRRIRSMMHLALKRLTLPFGDVYTTDGYDGVAAWVPPGKQQSGLVANLRLLPAMLSATGLRATPRAISVLDVMEKKHPHEPEHFYLLAIGVEPDRQGRGIGTALMQPILERCDREGIPAYLESSKERNVPLYERNGFTVTERIELPKDGPPVWLMWRDPR